MLGTSGNLSILITDNRQEARDNNPQSSTLQFIITASGKDKGELTEEDFLLINELGQCSSLETKNPSAETLLHLAIYQNTNANIVYHVHTTNSTLLSKQPTPALTFEGLEMLKGLGFRTHDVKVTIPVIDNNQDMKYLAKMVPNIINKNIPGFLLKGHGLYAWGNSPEETKKHVEIFEFLFTYRIKELSLKNYK